jgi:hypothetical protein
VSNKTAVAEEFCEVWKESKSFGGNVVYVSHDNTMKSVYVRDAQLGEYGDAVAKKT